MNRLQNQLARPDDRNSEGNVWPECTISLLQPRRDAIRAREIPLGRRTFDASTISRFACAVSDSACSQSSRSRPSFFRAARTVRMRENGFALDVCWSIRLFGWGGDTSVGVLNLGFIAIDPWTF